jgi:hypothetical protein
LSIIIPPPKNINPRTFELTPGKVLVKIFKTRDGGAEEFRSGEPLRQFDHHTSMDPHSRAVYYCAPLIDANLPSALLCCFVEELKQSTIVQPEEYTLATLLCTEKILLLDLRGDSLAANSGANTISLATTPNPSQDWSRYFYDNPDKYEEVDGLIYYSKNSSTKVAAITLYERAKGKFRLHQKLPLSDKPLRNAIIKIARGEGLIVAPDNN